MRLVGRHRASRARASRRRCARWRTWASSAVDNLPLPLLPQLIELLASRPDVDRAALGVDARSGDFLPGTRRSSRDLRERGHTVEVLFLDASRRDPDPPLLRDAPPPPAVGRRHPRRHRARARTLADLRAGRPSAVVDTGTLNVHVLRGLIQERYGRGEGELAVTLLSFGFKHGIPAEADVVLDVRFLPNPFFVPSCRRCRARTRRSPASCMDDPETRRLPGGRRELLRRSVHGFRARGQVLRDRRDRLHRRPSPLGRDRQGARPAPGRRFPISVRHRDIQRRRTSVVEARGSTRSAVAVGGKIRGSMATAQRAPGRPGHRDPRRLRRMPARRRRRHRRAGRCLDRGLGGAVGEFRRHRPARRPRL